MLKRKMDKIKFMIAGVVCCLAIAMPVMAFSVSDPYAIGPNETKNIGNHVTGTTTIYINTRPSSGGDVKITLSGGASGSATFPYRTSRDPWKVTNVDKYSNVVINGTATSNGTAGVLTMWGN